MIVVRKLRVLRVLECLSTGRSSGQEIEMNAQD